MISQKATILCILEILKKYSDEDHRISTEKIREKLKTIYDVDVERRTIYRNIDALREMGYDIQGYTDNREGYCLLERTFEASEIRLLCDAVAASEMITSDTSKKLIKRLSEMLSIFESRMLQRTVYVKAEKEFVNQKIFYNIDTLNVAINQGCKVNMIKLLHNCNAGVRPSEKQAIIFNPYATLWAKGNYYVIGKEDGDAQLTHHRIDRLQDIEILEQTVEMIFGGINPNQYAEKYIYNKGEQPMHFDIECEQELWEEIADTFETDACLLCRTHPTLQVRIKTIPSTMRTWVLGHCDKCQVVAPKVFKDEIQSSVMEGYKKYWG